MVANCSVYKQELANAPLGWH